MLYFTLVLFGSLNNMNSKEKLPSTFGNKGIVHME